MVESAGTRESFVAAHAKRRVPAMVLLWGLSAGLLGGSYYLSAQSALPPWLSIRPLVLCDVVHAAGFIVLGAVLCVALGQTFTRASLLLPAVLAFAGTTAWAFADEYHQMFVPGRFGCFSESLIDISGAIAGIAAWMGIASLRRRRQAPADRPLEQADTEQPALKPGMSGRTRGQLHS
jgi:hypothetical protein